jgi:23S rRNA pseudouridine1911/1915/1917 synthase
MDTIQVPTTIGTERVDKYLSDVLDKSRATIQHMIKTGHILVDEATVKANYRLKGGETIVVTPLPETTIELKPEAIPLDIVYQDDDLLVINKTHDLVVHPGAGNPDGTLVNALLYHVKDFQAVKGEIRPGIVHRLDKETSGLMVVAKTAAALAHLSDQMKDKSASRVYVALVEGVIPHNLGRIDAPIGRDPKQRQKMAVVAGGKPAVTHFQVLKRYEEHTLVECRLETGRTHQIRVHMNYIQHPVVGDPVYGRKKTDTTHGQYLHAKELSFIHPSTNERMTFTCDMPEYFVANLKELDPDA